MHFTKGLHIKTFWRSIVFNIQTIVKVKRCVVKPVHALPTLNPDSKTLTLINLKLGMCVWRR